MRVVAPRHPRHHRRRPPRRLGRAPDARPLAGRSARPGEGTVHPSPGLGRRPAGAGAGRGRRRRHRVRPVRAPAGTGPRRGPPRRPGAGRRAGRPARPVGCRRPVLRRGVPPDLQPLRARRAAGVARVFSRAAPGRQPAVELLQPGGVRRRPRPALCRGRPDPAGVCLAVRG
ncbi:hypothetical protein OY671_010827, partial [Metschnikowia pulcherrima]